MIIKLFKLLVAAYDYIVNTFTDIIYITNNLDNAGKDIDRLLQEINEIKKRMDTIPSKFFKKGNNENNS